MFFRTFSAVYLDPFYPSLLKLDKICVLYEDLHKSKLMSEFLANATRKDESVRQRPQPQTARPTREGHNTPRKGIRTS